MSTLGQIQIHSSVQFWSNTNMNIKNIQIFCHQIFEYFLNKLFYSLNQRSECHRTIICPKLLHEWERLLLYEYMNTQIFENWTSITQISEYIC